MVSEPRQTAKHNLPVQLTLLIGREQEVTAACVLVRRPEVRLVTLTGTGGIGKTRLGLQAASALLYDFSDGVYFYPAGLDQQPRTRYPHHCPGPWTTRS